MLATFNTQLLAGLRLSVWIWAPVLSQSFKVVVHEASDVVLIDGLQICGTYNCLKALQQYWSLKLDYVLLQFKEERNKE